MSLPPFKPGQSRSSPNFHSFYGIDAHYRLGNPAIETALPANVAAQADGDTSGNHFKNASQRVSTSLGLINCTRLPAAKIPAVVQGRDLVAAGVKPGPHMKTALDAAYNAQLENPDTPKDALITIALEAIST